MIKKITPLLLAVILIVSCNHKSRPTTALDTGRAFIRATLDGNFDEAKTLLYKDTFNIQYFDSYTQMYDRLPDAEKKSYKDADYTINKYNDESDSVSIINYSNSYMKKPQDIKVINKNGEWVVDFKYTIAN